MAQAGSKAVENGTQDQVDLVMEDSFSTFVRQDDPNFYTISENYDPDLLTEEGALKAAVMQGQEIGQVTLTFQEGLTYLEEEPVDSLSYPIYAAESVNHQNPILRLWYRFTNWVLN